MFRVAPYNQGQVRRKNDFDQWFNMMDRAFADEPSKEFVRGFKVDIRDQEDTYIFEADLPGIDKDNIFVDYKVNQLVLKVEVKKEEKEKEENYIRRERMINSMKRVFNVKDIQKDQISAKFENGVLTVVAPKLAEEDTSVKIEIQ